MRLAYSRMPFVRAYFRETAIQKLVWRDDGRPYIAGEDRAPAVLVAAPELESHPFPASPEREDFDAPKLPLDFQWLRRCSSRPSGVRLRVISRRAVAPSREWVSLCAIAPRILRESFGKSRQEPWKHRERREAPGSNLPRLIARGAGVICKTGWLHRDAQRAVRTRAAAVGKGSPFSACRVAGWFTRRKEGARFTQHDWTIVAEISLADRDHPPVLHPSGNRHAPCARAVFPRRDTRSGSETKRSEKFIPLSPAPRCRRVGAREVAFGLPALQRRRRDRVAPIDEVGSDELRVENGLQVGHGEASQV